MLGLPFLPGSAAETPVTGPVPLLRRCLPGDDVPRCAFGGCTMPIGKGLLRIAQVP